MLWYSFWTSEPLLFKSVTHVSFTCLHVSFARIAEPSGWKRPLRSLSPTVHPALTAFPLCLLHRVKALWATEEMERSKNSQFQSFHMHWQRQKEALPKAGVHIHLCGGKCAFQFTQQERRGTRQQKGIERGKQKKTPHVSWQGHWWW